jgi:hypothetical protein
MELTGTSPAILTTTMAPALVASSTPTPSLAPPPTKTQVATATTAALDQAACSPANFVPETFFPDNIRLLGRTDTGAVIFNLETLEEEGFIEAPKIVYRAALSPDGQTLAWDNTIEAIRLSDQKFWPR